MKHRAMGVAHGHFGQATRPVVGLVMSTVTQELTSGLISPRNRLVQVNNQPAARRDQFNKDLTKSVFRGSVGKADVEMRLA